MKCIFRSCLQLGIIAIALRAIILMFLNAVAVGRLSRQLLLPAPHRLHHLHPGE